MNVVIQTESFKEFWQLLAKEKNVDSRVMEGATLNLPHQFTYPKRPVTALPRLSVESGLIFRIEDHVVITRKTIMVEVQYDVKEYDDLNYLCVRID